MLIHTATWEISAIIWLAQSTQIFQLNLKYRHVKITVTMITKLNHEIISSLKLQKKNGKKINTNIEIQETQGLTENSENQNTVESR